MALFGRKKDKDRDDETAAVGNEAHVSDARAMRTKPKQDPEAFRAAAVQQAMQHGADMSVADRLAQAQRLAGQRGGGVDISQVLDTANLSASGRGAGSWVDAVLHPQSDFMRRCRCDVCGGPKRLPSPTAYLYCDYCGALADFDFRALVRSSAEIADRAAYATAMNQIGPQSREARAAGDRATYARVRERFYDTWLTATPKAASHRVGGPTYRAAFIKYMVDSSLATDFDPRYEASEERIKQTALGLRYTGMQVDPTSFWPLLDSYLEQRELADSLLKASGVVDLDPDRASDAIRHRIAMSAMVQGWMTSLTPEAGEELLARTGLQGDYRRIEPVTDGARRHCGQCGSEFTCLVGAKTVVCDHCGHQLDVGSAEWPCGTCGGLMTMPAGATETRCPYCRAFVSRVGR